jgi:hypothetical protein
LPTAKRPSRGSGKQSKVWGCGPGREPPRIRTGTRDCTGFGGRTVNRSSRAAPHEPDAAPEEVPANKEASPATDAPAAATDEKLLRVLARAFDGLSPEQQEAKWLVLKNALDTPKTADAPKIANPGTPREGSKISQVIEMLKREGGTTLEEIMSTMAWQKHTTRAMLSAGGSLAKKHGLVVTSERVGENRIYSIKA